jgi:hypothetical protein
MAVASSSPPADGAGVPTDIVISVSFTDYPDPDTVGLGSMLLTTGVFRVPETYHLDLASKTVTMTPTGPLVTRLGYSVSVLAALRSLAGCAAMPELVSFVTGDGAAGRSAPIVPTLSSDVQPIFDSRCAGNCHADGSGGCLATPVSGLSLCAAEARDALVGAPSREVSGLLRVAPGDSARSYLLRKVLPATAGGGPIPTTLGEREPPGAPLTATELATIAAWIDGGALP